MPARRKISSRQLELLVEFAESHRDIALGRLAGGPLGNQATRQAWTTLATELNAVGEGLTKTPEQWRRYWIEMKAKVKSKAADSRRNASATGGGPSRIAPLNEMELRVLGFIGLVAVEGETGVRLPSNIPDDETDHPLINITSIPVPTPSTAANPPSPTLDNSLLLEPSMEEEWLEEETSPTRSQCDDPPSPVPRIPPILPIANTPHSSPPLVPVDDGAANRVLSERDSQGQRRVSRRTRSTRTLRRIHQDERVPRWAYDMEMRRIAVEERLAAALEGMRITQEDMLNLFRTIYEEIRTHIL